MKVENQKAVSLKESGQKKAVSLFHNASKFVPAYADFLKRNGIKPEKVRSWQDFQNIPEISKQNYLRQYTLEELCWGGKLEKNLIFTSTSGSTGKPFYFPREKFVDWQYSKIVSYFLDNSVRNPGPVLVINGFSMGVWIGGLITYNAFDIVSQNRRLNKISIINPGINLEQIIAALDKLSSHYSSTVLIGYPPFIKDVIDAAQSRGINLEKIDLKLFFAAETFSEQFRDYLVNTAGVQNRYCDTMNIYGSADMGAMGFETPLSIMMREIALGDKNFYEMLFSGVTKFPTLVQFHPEYIQFEEDSGELLLTANNAIPLIRYAIGDQGGVLQFDEVWDVAKKCSIDLHAKLADKNIASTVIEYPFVYLYERKDFVTTLYGLQIYPEPIRDVLLEDRHQAHFSGRFTMSTEFDDVQNQFLAINIEMRPGISIEEEVHLALKNGIVLALTKKNSEYGELRKYLGHRAEPQLFFLKHGDPKYFTREGKQKWVK